MRFKHLKELSIHFNTAFTTKPAALALNCVHTFRYIVQINFKLHTLLKFFYEIWVRTVSTVTTFGTRRPVAFCSSPVTLKSFILSLAASYLIFAQKFSQLSENNHELL